MKDGDELLDTLTGAAFVARAEVDAQVVFVAAVGGGVVQAVHVSLGPVDAAAVFRAVARYCDSTVEAIEAGLPYEHNDPRITGR